MKLNVSTLLFRIGSPHCLPMGTYLSKLIAARMTQTDDSEFPFPSWAKTGRITEALKAVAKVSEISGAPFALHDLRRTFATIAESLDISTYGVKRLLNHSVNQNDLTSGYIVTDVERLRKPMQQTEDFVLAAVRERKVDCSKKPQSKHKAAALKSKGNRQIKRVHDSRLVNFVTNWFVLQFTYLVAQV